MKTYRGVSVAPPSLISHKMAVSDQFQDPAAPGIHCIRDLANPGKLRTLHPGVDVLVWR
jgi:hypothetical protein